MELNSESTHEDIQAAVDEIISNQQPTDTETIANEQEAVIQEEHTDEPEEVVEESGWLDDDLKAEVAAYGIDDDQLSEFSSREELERAIKFLDRAALETGRKAKTPDEKEEPIERKSSFEIDLDEDIYGESLINQITAMRDHYEDRFAALEQRFVESEAIREEQQFDDIVDSLGHADIFGMTGKENSKQLERRKELHLAVKAQQIGMQTLMNREVELDKAFINKVARMVFSDELGKKELKARTKKVAKQSDSRMGGTATRAHNSVEPLRDEMRRLYKELEGA